MRFQVSTMTATKARQSRGFTLAEVAIAIAIVTMIFAGIILAYTQATYRAEWTGYSLAAESLAVKQIEQARSARWDPAAVSATGVPMNQLYQLNLLGSNYNSGTRVYTGYTWTNLDLPSNGTNFMCATNFVTVKPVPGSTMGSNIMVRVDTVWKFRWRSLTKLYTNTICTYLAPDNKDSTDLFGN
jgi:prepilin-type N-terminal cleavage/methylation domain-containing protein